MNRVKNIEDMHRLSEEEFESATKLPIVAVLDQVRSQHNVGAVFRSADAFAIEAVYLCGICPTPDNIEVHKTALGAERTVHSTYFSRTREAIDSLHARGYKVYAVEIAENSLRLEDIPINAHSANKPHGIAVVFGHEVFGVSQDVVDLCDGCIEIPQFGTKHSLNVSVTAGIVLYELSTTMRK